VPRLSAKLALCEMLREAQQRGPFYAAAADHGCGAGPFVLGHESVDPVFESGRIGPELGVYRDEAANRRVYEELPRLPAGKARFVRFSRLEDLTFDPDLVVVTARPSEAEILTRAHGYANGASWEARGTTVIGCAYLYAYPIASGRMNILITGLHHGMRARGVFPEGLLLVSIPKAALVDIAVNLEQMIKQGLIDLPQYHWGREEHEKHMRTLAERLRKDLGQSATDGT